MDTRTIHKITFLLWGLLLVGSFSAQGQSKAEAMREVEKLLQKAVGQKVLNFVGQEQKIISQVFGEKLVAVTLKSNDTNWTSEYTQIPWEQVKDYFYGQAKGNKSLYQLNIEFKGKVTHYYFHDSADKGESQTFSSVELYFKQSDLEKIKQYMNIIQQ